MLPSQKFRVRRPGLDDIPDMLQLMNTQVEREGAGQIGHWFSYATSAEQIELAILGKRVAEYFVAEAEGGEIVGYYAGEYLPLSYNRKIVTLYENGWHTKQGWERQGIGWALIRAAEESAKSRGIKHFSIGAPCNEWSPEKMQSYLKRGYSPFEIITYKTIR